MSLEKKEGASASANNPSDFRLKQHVRQVFMYVRNGEESKIRYPLGAISCLWSGNEPSSVTPTFEIDGKSSLLV